MPRSILIDRLSRTLARIFGNSMTAGVLLLLCAAVAMFAANSPWAAAYDHFWHTPVEFRVGSQLVGKSLLHWINDGLMAMFFFTVGLELKREVIGGHLSTLRKALLPLVAALGGMAVPALLFALLNPQGEASRGWGIPMATDIAFAVGILAILGKRVPVALKVFITALAIADDLGSVLVIALFYTSTIDTFNILMGLGFLALLAGSNALGIRAPLWYGVIGIAGIWGAFLFSGIHPSIAGVLIAFTIPARPTIDEEKFSRELNRLNEEFHAIPPNDVTLLEPEQVEAIGRIQELTRSADTPLQRLEHGLTPVVSFLVMPVFALANSAVPILGISRDALLSPVTLGVFLGLLLGKFVGVFGATWLMVRLGAAQLDASITTRRLAGGAVLCGVGFTMSMFVTTLAFGEGVLAQSAKVGIMAASAGAGLLAFLILRGARDPGDVTSEP